MIPTIHAWLAVAGLAGTLGLAGCTKPSGPDIVGVWQAEDAQFDSLRVAIGPRLEISNTEVFMPDLNTRLPISSIEREKRDEVILRFSLVGWTIYFDTVDRMHVDVPLAGRLYYRRIKETVAAASVGTPEKVAPQPASAERAAVSPVSRPEQKPEVTVVAARAPVHLPSASATDRIIERAYLAAQQDDTDTALRILSDALSAGTLNWSAVEREPRLMRLGQDVRYQALQGRYR